MQHGRFVRALARSLLADEHAAEDVAQETWVRFLERPPRSALDPRGWLAAVVRNLASNARRDRDRRSEREATAALPASPTPEGDDLAEAEVLRTVVEAVLALDEPYRSVVLARYFRGWEPNRIADETRVPIATVKSRLQRALAMLRERLDREHGSREAWGLALAPFADLGHVATSIAIWKVAAAAVLVAIPGFVAWKIFAGRTSTQQAESSTSGIAASETAAPEPPRVDGGTPAPERTVAVAAAPKPGTIRLSGTVRNLPYPELDLPGGPAAGLELSVSESFFGGPSAPKFGRISATTRENGSFELEVPRPEKGGGSYTLHSKADETWRSVSQEVQIAEGEPAREGIELTRGAHGLLHGVVVDATGRPVPAARMLLRASTSKREEREFTTDDKGTFDVSWKEVMSTARAVDATSTVMSMDPLVPKDTGGWETARIVVAAAATLRIRVVDAAGQGLPEMTVRADLAPGERCAQGIWRRMFVDPSLKYGKTDAHGEVELASVCAGHHLELSVDEHKATSQRSGEILFDAERGAGEPIVLDSGEVRTLVARWTGDLRVVGRTLTSDGTPVPDVGLQFTDLGVRTDGRGENLGVLQSGNDAAFEAHFRSRTLRGPIRIVAREKRSSGSSAADNRLRNLGYVNSLPPTDGAIGSRTLELGEAIDGVFHADVVLEPGLSISGRIFDSAGNQVMQAGVSGHRVWTIASGGSLLDAQMAFDEFEFEMDKEGRFTILGLRKGDYDLFVTEEIRSFYTWPAFIHRFPGIPAGAQGMELRMPSHEEVRVKIRTHGEGIDREIVLHGKLTPRDPAREKQAAEENTNVVGVDGWPVGAALDFGGAGGASAGEGYWSYGFYDTKEIAQHTLQPMEPGWYVFGVHPSADKGAREWFPQSTEPRWYGPGEYTIDFDAVPTATIEGRILADATREHLGVELVTESGGLVPLEAGIGFSEPSHVVETDAAGRFVLHRAPVGKFRLRAGNVAELERGRFRSETPIEVGAAGLSALEIRF